MLAKETLVELYYNQKLSMAEIAKKLGVSNSNVYYWMGKYGIPRRTRSEAIYIKQNPKGDPFKIKELKTKEDVELFTLGVGLYIYT
jgi:transposase-like protein